MKSRSTYGPAACMFQLDHVSYVVIFVKSTKIIYIYFSILIIYSIQYNQKYAVIPFNKIQVRTGKKPNPSIN